MNEQPEVSQEEVAVETVEQLSPLKQALLLKKAKKKAKKSLEKQGMPKNVAQKLVKQAVKNIASKPPRKASGRGR